MITDAHIPTQQTRIGRPLTTWKFYPARGAVARADENGVQLPIVVDEVHEVTRNIRRDRPTVLNLSLNDLDNMQLLIDAARAAAQGRVA